MATIKDVALRANVSKMTVSRVINHPELVTDELKALVHKAMEELDYKPNTAAKALAQNRTLVVKLLILEEIDVAEPHYMHLITGIARALDQRQYALQLLTENTIDLGSSDGYIIAGAKESDYEWIKDMKTPVVIFGENTHNIPFVDSDNYQSVKNATQHAIECGYERIVFMGIDAQEQFELSREKGYLDAMKEADLPVLIHRLRNSSSSTSDFIKEMVDLEPNTCFVCASDRIGIGVENGLLARGLKVPNDYGVIGFDGVFLDQMAVKPLTTVRQNIVELGAKCVEQLMMLIDHKPLEQSQLFLKTEFVKRGSTR